MSNNGGKAEEPARFSAHISDDNNVDGRASRADVE